MLKYALVSTLFHSRMTVGPGRRSVDYWEDVGGKFSIVRKLDFEVWLLYDMLGRFGVSMISTQNHRDMNKC